LPGPADTPAYLGRGGNIGDPRHAMASSLRALDGAAAVRVAAVSSLYRTPPWGRVDQPDFLNCVARVETALSARALLDLCPVPRHIIGLAIGLVSFIGYLPDVLLPLYDGFLSRHYPRDVSFQIYFTSIALCGYLGAVLCLVFWRRSRRARMGGGLPRDGGDFA